MDDHKFAVDRMLGKLAKWLRLLGYDALFLKNGPLSPLPDRILLTRRSTGPRQPSLADWPRVIRLRSDQTSLQLGETIQALGISADDIKPFSRCSVCNALLRVAGEEEIRDLVPEYVRHTQREFLRCPECQKIYWPATHRQRISNEIQKAFSSGEKKEASICF
ncbi:MAG: Mut7-C RNAse domain-containing protein [Pseudomonadota bacterium]